MSPRLQPTWEKTRGEELSCDRDLWVQETGGLKGLS